GVQNKVFAKSQGRIVSSPAAKPLERDAATTQWLLDWVTSKHQHPWLTVAFFDATHWPYWAPGQPEISLNLGESWFFRDRIDELKDRYRRSAAEVDRQLGQVFGALKASNQWESTVVVLLGDHGEAFYEHGVFMHG